MRINKYILGLAVGVLGLFSSCNTDVLGPLYNGTLENVSFDGSSLNVSVASDESSVVIPVTINRGVLKNASTIAFTAEASEEGIFSNDANGVITFKEGQNTATINVIAENLEKDQTYTYTLTLSDDAALTADTISGANQNLVCVIEVTREGDWTAWETWNEEGTADYYYSGVFFEDEDLNLSFYYRQHLTDENRYQFRLDNWGWGVSLILNYDEETGFVTIPKMYTGYDHPDYGEVWFADYGTYAGEEIFGTFDKKTGIFRIPIVYYDTEGPWGDDYEEIWIDGYARPDLSSSLTYSGVLIDPQGKTFALGKLKLGKDVENALALIVDADADPSAVADALAAGEVEGTLVKAGDIQVPIEDGMSGTMQLVVAVISDGAVGSYTSALFEYYNGANPWKSLGMAYYTDDFVTSFFGKEMDGGEFIYNEPYTYQVEVEESVETPGLFRLKNAYAPVARRFMQEGGEKNFVIHAENPNAVYFLTQPIGLDFGFGEMSISSEGGDAIEYFAEKGMTADQVIESYPEVFGTLEDGVITLPAFPLTDEDDNPVLDDDENPIYYQGYLYDDEGGYYTGMHSAFKLILPTASAGVKAKAKSLAAARKFENGLKAFSRRCVKKHVRTTKGKFVFNKTHKRKR